jgi:hypothetical protein
LDTDPFWGKGHFWREKHEVGKRKLEGKEARVGEACKRNLTTLGLGFFQEM